MTTPSPTPLPDAVITAHSGAGIIYVLPTTRDMRAGLFALLFALVFTNFPVSLAWLLIEVNGWHWIGLLCPGPVLLLFALLGVAMAVHAIRMMLPEQVTIEVRRDVLVRLTRIGWLTRSRRIAIRDIDRIQIDERRPPRRPSRRPTHAATSWEARAAAMLDAMEQTAADVATLRVRTKDGAKIAASGAQGHGIRG